MFEKQNNLAKAFFQKITFKYLKRSKKVFQKHAFKMQFFQFFAQKFLIFFSLFYHSKMKSF